MVSWVSQVVDLESARWSIDRSVGGGGGGQQGGPLIGQSGMVGQQGGPLIGQSGMVVSKVVR